MSHFILSKEIAYRKIQRMAYEVLERNVNEKQIILAGIKESGLIIAHILHGFLKEIFKDEIIVLEIKIDKNGNAIITGVENSQRKTEVVKVKHDGVYRMINLNTCF